MNFKKLLTSVLAAGVLSFTCATAVNADWTGSKVTNGGGESAATETVTGTNGTAVAPDNIKVTPVNKADARTQEVHSVVYASGSKSVEAVLESFTNGAAAYDALEKEAGVKGITISKLSPVTVFDVSLTGVELKEGEKVDIPVKVEGINAGDKVIAIHFAGEAGNLTPEVIPSKVDENNGNVILTMGSFSPVLILKDTTPATPNKTPGTGNYASIALWGGVLVVAVAAAGVVLFEKKRKAN